MELWKVFYGCYFAMPLRAEAQSINTTCSPASRCLYADVSVLKYHMKLWKERSSKLLRNSLRALILTVYLFGMPLARSSAEPPSVDTTSSTAFRYRLRPEAPSINITWSTASRCRLRAESLPHGSVGSAEGIDWGSAVGAMGAAWAVILGLAIARTGAGAETRLKCERATGCSGA
jgi:hypothetical protein